MGKAIYKPVGKAEEYARWACNLYLGCSNDCDYCYCKKGVLGTVAGGKEATLKKCFRDEADAFAVFVRELTSNADRIRKEGGLFFSFSSDPMLPGTADLTMQCVMFATGMDVPCQILTKCAAWTADKNIADSLRMVKDKVAVGFTLTGMDEMEKGPTVASNEMRVAVLQGLHAEGFRTFVSMEPVIDPRRAMQIFSTTIGDCDFYKVGLLSGKNDYDIPLLMSFISGINIVCSEQKVPVYWKKSVRRLVYPIEAPCCVESDYDIFVNNSKK